MLGYTPGVRRLGRIFAVLLILAGGGLWLRSYWRSDFIGWGDKSRWIGMLSMGGLLRFEHANYGETSGWQYVSYATPSDGLWGEVRHPGTYGRVWGLGYRCVNYSGSRQRRSIYLPIWCPLVLVGLPWAWSMIRRRRQGPRGFEIAPAASATSG